MSWFKVDDGLPFHHKVVAAGNTAMGAWVRMGAWSAAHLTDGKVPRGVAMLIAFDDEVLSDLVVAGLLETDGDDYELHDFLHYNPTKRKVISKRRATALRVGRYRVGNGVTNTVGNTSPVPSRPVPSRTRSRPDQIQIPDSSEPAQPPASKPPALMQFVTVGKARSWDLTEDFVAVLTAGFPNLDVLSEARKAKAWVGANPTKAKTARGMSKFLYGWMDRAQNRSGAGQANGGNGQRDLRVGNARPSVGPAVTGEVKL